MVDRVKSKRIKLGRPKGGIEEWKRVAIARAQRQGMLPDELLKHWATTGYMDYVGQGPRKARAVELSPAERISCAKGCAQFYKAPMRAAEGERPMVLTLDENLLAVLMSSGQPKMLETLRDVLLDLQAGKVSPTTGDKADPQRYAETLRASSPTVGRA